MKTNEDVLKQLLRKISSLESRMQFLEEGNPNVSNPHIKKEDPDYCHQEFMNKMYPNHLAIVECKCNNCAGLSQALRECASKFSDNTQLPFGGFPSAKLSDYDGKNGNGYQPLPTCGCKASPPKEP